MLLVSGGSKTVRDIGPSEHLGVLLVPGAGNRAAPGFAWALDNGAFAGFDERRFVAMLERHANRAGEALWCTAPDVVGDAEPTRALLGVWEPRIRHYGYPVAYVAQDGETPEAAPWDAFDAIFIGGTTAWKESPAAGALVREGRRLGKRTHMGRVNSVRRMRIAHSWGVQTFDGTQCSRWPSRWIPWTINHLRNLERQSAFPWN